MPKKKEEKPYKGLKGYKFWRALSNFIVFSLIIFIVSSYLLKDFFKIGLAFILLGFLSILILKIYKISYKSIYPDILFGAIDNGILVFAAVLGGHFAGITGAIIGGAAGNTITDGIGGLFEGHLAEHQRAYQIENRRTALSTSFGKMAGCLFGAGIGLIIVWLFNSLI